MKTSERRRMTEIDRRLDDLRIQAANANFRYTRALRERQAIEAEASKLRDELESLALGQLCLPVAV